MQPNKEPHMLAETVDEKCIWNEIFILEELLANGNLQKIDADLIQQTLIELLTLVPSRENPVSNVA